ncbi:MAG: Eco57I restriction-modification methylase domain-containing protein [Myxococcales bacterium]
MTPRAASAPDDRRRYGRYYTPRPMVRALYRLLTSALEANGLDPAACALVDPACGDGAFLCTPEAEAFGRSLGLDLDAAAVTAARAAAPGALILEGDAYGDGLTALTNEIAGHGSLIVIGNPPYVGNSELLRNGRRYRQVRDTLLPFARDVARGTSIRDDYVLFFGVADRLIEAAGGRGAIAFVTSASFVDNFLYAPLRRWLLSRYRLNALVEAGERLFDGARVATVLSVWTRCEGDPGRSYLHARLSGSVEERLATLERGPRLSETRPHGEALLLNAPAEKAASAAAKMRESGAPIGSVLRVSFPGLKTRFDELLTADTREALAKRMRAFFEANDPDEFAERHRIPERARSKLAVAFEARARTRFRKDAIRPFARYAGTRHRFRVPPQAMAFAYVDRELIPRGDHRFRGTYDPHRDGPKLVFNVREVPLSAAVVEGPVCVHDYRHSRFAPLWVPPTIAEGWSRPTGHELPFRELNLSRAWAESARLLREPADLFYFICAAFNSAAVQELFAPAFGASEEAPVPRFDGRRAKLVQALADEARELEPGGALSVSSERAIRALYGLD